MNPNEEIATGKALPFWLRLLGMLAIVGGLSGSMSAFFLWALDAVTVLHLRNPWLLLLLPVAGMVVAWFYSRYGTEAARGSHLLVEEIHELNGKVPLRMAPLVLGGTLITHLFGGSAGREGTAVQMGGAVAAWLSRVFSLHKGAQRMVLMAGIAAGFGAVFGTPWAGAVFAVELPVRGRWQTRMLLPMLFASWMGHMTCLAWGAHHCDFRRMNLSEDGLMSLSLPLLWHVVLAAVAFGLCARMFVVLSHGATAFFARVSPDPLWRPFLGGVLIIVLVFSLGTADYLGLGVNAMREGGVSLISSFSPGGADAWSWFWKLAFTVVTLSSGFKGGEVTPLLFIGAALGNVFAMITGQPVEVFAGIGMVAVFAAASNTPLACTLMGVELFGMYGVAYFALGCLIAYVVSGREGIYQNQK